MFKLVRIEPEQRRWALIYQGRKQTESACEDDSSFERDGFTLVGVDLYPLAELKIEVGLFAANHDKGGLLASLRCFAPALRGARKGGCRGRMPAIARLVIQWPRASGAPPTWEVRQADRVVEVAMEGSVPTQSFRSSMGLVVSRLYICKSIRVLTRDFHRSFGTKSGPQ